MTVWVTARRHQLELLAPLIFLPKLEQDQPRLGRILRMRLTRAETYQRIATYENISVQRVRQLVRKGCLLLVKEQLRLTENWYRESMNRPPKEEEA